MEHGLEQLVRECAEAMLEEDIELSEARDFTVDPVGRKMVAREHGFAVISASRDDDYFRPARADSKRDWRRFRRSGEKPEFDPNRKIVNPEVEIASRFGRIIPDRKSRTNALKRDLVRLGWEFRPCYGGYKAENEDAGGGEHTFIVYPCKYDHGTHEVIVGDFISDEDEIGNWMQFRREMLWLGQRYRQVAVYFAEPLCMHREDDEAKRHKSIRSSDNLRRNGTVEDGEHAGELDFQARNVRPSRTNDVNFTNLDGRSGRTKETRTAANNMIAANNSHLSGRTVRRKRKRLMRQLDPDRLARHSFTADD